MIKKIVFLCLLILCSCSKDTTSQTQDVFIKGADMSFLPLIESNGTQYYNANDEVEDALVTLKKSGCNTVRIRVWKNSPNSLSTFSEVKLFAQRVRNLGLKVWICIHYSDTWADPGAQTIPAEWANLSFSELKVAVSNYTSTIASEIKPDIIQIGNEVNNGFMWPKADLVTHENEFLELLNGASSAIKVASPETKIMIHYAGIGSDAEQFYTKMTSVNYDYIGLSYYPIWHGKNLEEVKTTINTLGQAFNKKVIIAETSYPFTLGFDDWTNNVLGTIEQIIPSFSATPAGQKSYLLALKNKIKETQYGFGFCYWGTEWLAFRGNQSTNGSSWENQALWNFDNVALPGMDVFKE